MPDRSKLFISYCHEDIRWLRAVREQLAVLEREGLLDVFEDTQLRAGEQWYERLHTEMSQARVGLLLVSAPFLSSPFVRDQEIPKLFATHAESGMVIYPLLVRPCPWQQVPWLAPLQLRPQDAKRRAKAVSAFSGAARDQVLADVAPEIATLVVKKAATSGRAGQASVSTVAKATTADTGAFLQTESIVVRFSEAVNLNAGPIHDVLTAYSDELNSGKLEGFEFAPDQISIELDPIYRRLADRLVAGGSANSRKSLKQLEQVLRRGLLLLLNIAYLREKQIHNAYQACFWFARAVRCLMLAVLSAAIDPAIPEEEAYVKEANPSSLYGNFQSIEDFYGFKLIKLDLWHPDRTDAPSFSLYFRTEGYAGEWFSEHPQQPGPFQEHWSPDSFYNFVLPQVALRHVLLNEPFPEDWNGYWIGAA